MIKTNATPKFNSSTEGVIAIDAGVNLNPLDIKSNADKYGQYLTIDDKIWMLQEMNKHGKKVTDNDLGNQSLFFTRSLEYLMSSAFDIQYEKLPFRDLFPIVNEGGPGIREIVAEVYDAFGQAKLINQGASDIPFVAAGGREDRYPVSMFGIGASWNLQELHSHQVAMRNGRGRRSPQQSRQAAAIRGMEEALNNQALYGTDEVNIPGFLSHPNIPKGTIAPGASGSTTWENKTADEILADIDSLGTSIWTSTNMIEKPNTLVLPPSKLALLTQRRLDNRDISIMTYLKENSLFFNSDSAFIPVNEYEGAGVGGTGLMTAYDKNENKLRMEIPQELQTLPTQQHLFNYMMLYYSYSAGCIVLYPKSCQHAEGI